MSSVPDSLAALAIVAPAATGLIGYWLAGRNEEARDTRAAAREDASRLAARTDLLDDERQAFQREVLLELQDRLLALTRTTTQVILQDRRTLKGDGQIYQLPEGLSERNHEAGVALLRIRERVLNDDLRRELQGLQEFATQVELLSLQLREGVDPKQAIKDLDAASLGLTKRHTRVNEILGQELRKVLGRDS